MRRTVSAEHLPLSTRISGEGTAGLRLRPHLSLNGLYRVLLVLPWEVVEQPDVQAVREARDRLVITPQPHETYRVTVVLPEEERDGEAASLEATMALNAFRGLMERQSLGAGTRPSGSNYNALWYWPENGQETTEGIAYGIVVPDRGVRLKTLYPRWEATNNMLDLVVAGAALVSAHADIMHNQQ